MEKATPSPTAVLSRVEHSKDEPGIISSESVLNILRLILAGSPLSEVLTIIAQLVESEGEDTLCTIWLPDEDGRQLHCAAAPSLPGFGAHVGPMMIGPQGGSCGTAIYRREPVYVSDIFTDPVWDLYRDRMVPYGIRSVWSRPLFTSAGKPLGTFAILYREKRSPGSTDLRLIENASHITGIAIERHRNEEELRCERDRLRLLLEITNSMTSRLDLRRLVEALSTNLLRVTRCDFCALLLPDADSGELRLTILYNPGSRGFLSDDFSELGANLLFEIASLFRLLVSVLDRGFIVQRILNRNGHLAGDLPEKFHVVFLESAFRPLQGAQDTEHPASAYEWQIASRLQAFRRNPFVNKPAHFTTESFRVIA